MKHENDLDEVNDIHLLENNDNEENPEPTDTTDIDEMTLALLMNKNHYRKYVTQTNPEEHEIEIKRIADNRKYANRIMELTKKLLSYPDTQITTDIDEIFVAYTKRLVQHFKTQDREHQTYKNGYEDESNDDDVLFGNIEDTPRHDETCTRSFWGKERVIKKGGVPMANYDMRMFSNR